jgi:hypothetical protein
MCWFIRWGERRRFCGAARTCVNTQREQGRRLAA